MKKITILIVMFCSILFASVKAQISIGPRIGINISTISNITQGITGATMTSSSGLHFGGVINIGINDMFSIQTELLFTRKGGRVKYTTTIDTDRRTITLNHDITYESSYLEVPILAKFSYGGKYIKGFVNLGPYFGYWGDQSINDNIAGYSISSSDWTGYNRIDVGLAIGAGAAFKIGPGNLLTELRYDLGLTSTTNKEGLEPEDNRCLMISIGYLFRLGCK